MKKFIKIFFLSASILLILLAGYYFLIRKLDKDALEMKDYYSSSYKTGQPVLLPSVFINGERFYIKMPAANGDTLLAFGDTGGGITMIMPATANRLILQSKIKTALIKGFMPAKYIRFSDVVRGESIPPPMPLRTMILRTPFARLCESYLFVPPMDGELKFITQIMPLDIFLGQNFFMGNAWTFDYLHRQIWVNTTLPATEEGKPGVQKIGFKKNDRHENIYGHPSMSIEVDGEKIDVLFDAGASIVLSENGKKAFNTTERSIGGSFIATSVFDKWRQLHPGWKYFEKADMTRDVIEVPLVKVNGLEAGPVWFAKRPDDVWSEGMIGSMDKVVKGALGGSALKYFKVTIDYNSDLIKFEN